MAPGKKHNNRMLCHILTKKHTNPKSPAITLQEALRPAGHDFL